MLNDMHGFIRIGKPIHEDVPDVFLTEHVAIEKERISLVLREIWHKEARE
jgi:hypothetical protein